MPDTIRKKIIDAVIARFKTIVTTNTAPGATVPYQTNVGNNVWQERAKGYNPDDITAPGALNVFFPTEKDSNAVSRHIDHEMTVEVYGLISAGDDSSKICEQMLADLTQAIGADIQWGDNARDTLPGEFEKDIEQDTKKVVGFKRTFTIRYRTLRFNPYDKG